MGVRFKSDIEEAKYQDNLRRKRFVARGIVQERKQGLREGISKRIIARKNAQIQRRQLFLQKVQKQRVRVRGKIEKKQIKRGVQLEEKKLINKFPKKRKRSLLNLI